MSEDAWSKDTKKRFSVNPIVKDNVAQSYFHPNLNHATVKINSDEPDFFPKYEKNGEYAFIFANIPSGLILSNNESFTMDFGFNLEISKGHRIKAESLISSLFVVLLESNRFKLNLFNVGDNLVLKHKQKIAKIWVEPIYLFKILEN